MESYRRAAAMLSEAGHFPRAVAALRLALEMRRDDVDLISELIRMELKKNQRPGRASPTPSPSPRIPTPDAMLALPVLEEAVTNPGITIEMLQLADEWPQVRRLNARAVALKPGPEARWVVIESETDIRVSFADTLVESERDDELT